MNEPSSTSADRSAEPAAHPSVPSASQAFEDAAAAARQQLAAVRAPANSPPKPPSALRDLPAGTRPVERYLAGRNAREASMVDYRKKLRRTREWLVHAGFPAEYAAVPIEEFPWHCTTEAMATRFRELVVEYYASPKSSENLLGVLRSLLRECAAADLISLEWRERLLECLPVRSRPRPQAGREIDEAEVVQLLGWMTAGERPIDMRDAAMVAVLLSTGMRASELVDLDLDDWDPETRHLRVRRAKGGGGYDTWLHPALVPLLERWLAARGSQPGPLFCSARGSEVRLTSKAWGPRLTRQAKRAGLSRALTSHDFRRTFITRMLREGNDPFTIKRIVGHRNVSSTLIYDRRTKTEDRAAVDDLAFPHLPDLRGGAS